MALRKIILRFTLILCVISGFVSLSIVNTSCKKKVAITKDTIDSAVYSKMTPEIKSLTDKIAKDDDNADLYHLRAKLFIAQNDVESASKDMLKVIALDTTKSDYFYTLGDLYFMMGKAGNSKAALQKCLSLDPKNTDAILKLAEISYLIKDYKKVTELTNTVLEIDNQNAMAYFIRGRSQKEAGDTATAVRTFQKATGIDPKFYDAFIQLGIIYAAKKKPIALDYYNSALNLRTNSAEALYNIGMYYQETKDVNKAIEAYTAILQVNPKGKQAHYLKLANYNLGFVNYEYLSKYDVAVKFFNSAVMADPKYIEAIYMHGLCLEKLKDFDGARREYKKALEINENYDKALLGINRLDDNIRKKSK